MNLIEKYGVDAYGLVQRYGGIDKCKEIIENAPPDAECYSWLLGDSGVRDKTVYLDDLRAAIATYECDCDWEDISRTSDSDRQLICTYCQATKSEPFELNAKRWADEDTDHCSDIRNHISPLTEVTER